MKKYKKCHQKSLHPKNRHSRQTQKSTLNVQSSVQKKKKKSVYISDMKLDSNNHMPLEITTLTQVPTELPEFFRKNQTICIKNTTCRT